MKIDPREKELRNEQKEKKKVNAYFWPLISLREITKLNMVTLLYYYLSPWQNRGDMATLSQNNKSSCRKIFPLQIQKILKKKSALRLFCRTNFVSAEFLLKDCLSRRDVKFFRVFVEFSFFFSLKLLAGMLVFEISGNFNEVVPKI